MINAKLATHTLSHIYGAAAAVCRGDSDAVLLLEKNDISRRHLCEGSIVVVAHAIKNHDMEINTVFLPPHIAELPSSIALLQGAREWLVNDHESARFSVLELDKSEFNPIYDTAILVAEIWKLAAREKNVSIIEYASVLCLAAGIVTSSV
jgi:hypothetical protein